MPAEKLKVVGSARSKLGLVWQVSLPLLFLYFSLLPSPPSVPFASLSSLHPSLPLQVGPLYSS